MYYTIFGLLIILLIIISFISDAFIMMKNIKAKRYLAPMYEWCTTQTKTAEEYITILENLNKIMKTNIKETVKNEGNKF